MEFKNGLNAAKEDYSSGDKFINGLDIIQNKNTYTTKSLALTGRKRGLGEIYEFRTSNPFSLDKVTGESRTP